MEILRPKYAALEKMVSSYFASYEMIWDATSAIRANLWMPLIPLDVHDRWEAVIVFKLDGVSKKIVQQKGLSLAQFKLPTLEPLLNTMVTIGGWGRSCHQLLNYSLLLWNLETSMRHPLTGKILFGLKEELNLSCCCPAAMELTPWLESWGAFEMKRWLGERKLSLKNDATLW